jgi:hypothetical protein
LIIIIKILKFHFTTFTYAHFNEASNSFRTIWYSLFIVTLTKTLLLAGMGTDTSDGTIKLQDEWKNDPSRDMNALNVLDVDFDMNKLVPLFKKMRH